MSRKVALRGLFAAGAIVAALAASTPAVAADTDPSDDGYVSINLQITKPRASGNTYVASIDTQWTKWNRRDALISPPGGPNYIPRYSTGSLSTKKAAMLQLLAKSDDLAKLNGIMIKINCGPAPVSTYELNAGDISVRIPVCGDDEPTGRGAFSQMVKIMETSTSHS